MSCLSPARCVRVRSISAPESFLLSPLMRCIGSKHNFALCVMYQVSKDVEDDWLIYQNLPGLNMSLNVQDLREKPFICICNLVGPILR